MAFDTHVQPKHCAKQRTGADYRLSECLGACKQLIGPKAYSNFVVHTCQDDNVSVLGLTMDITQQMAERVDYHSVTQLPTTTNEIWRALNGEFYLGQESAALVGLSREQVTHRVYWSRRLHYGGDIHSQIAVHPLAIVSGSCSMNFFQLQYSCRDGMGSIVLLVGPIQSSKYSCGTDAHSSSSIAPSTVSTVHFINVWWSCVVMQRLDAISGWNHTVYWNIFHFAIVTTDHHLDAESVICDYEGALIAAIRDQMPNIAINGCLYRWKQANPSGSGLQRR
ncbi:hypothetical protein PHMEG_00014606 [Phytophthora megakarya]|uniref:Uncharacterized protein n=1 Tax=Phytophthora megakarya TaxID=4795 RepID=A0A225W4F3_9STRA|nr:hypothetical protein PHMEG_00014606 [Phytophthora megakarya]